MKETKFIEQNQKKWERFEKLYASKSEDPEELSDLYMDITNDLGYAQTFYKRRTVKVYLNQLAQKVFSGVHKQKGEPLKNLLQVWQISLPLEIYRSRKNLLFALIAFLGYAILGAVTTSVNPDFPRIVLGDGYVEMTLENITKGNPLAVYESDDQTAMFIMITTNNLKVAFLTFFAGFFFTIGTHLLLFSNGVMLGSFQSYFYTKGLLLTSFLGIWIHGAFEISSIVLAGGAGITVGSGLLFPGSYSRLQALQLSAKRGLKIMLSLVPFIIAAGFLESFVTHNYDVLPDWSKWLVIAFSFGMILFVYVIYPIMVARKYPHLIEDEELFTRKEKKEWVLYKMRNTSDILFDSFQFYRMNFGKFMRPIIYFVLPFVLILVAIQDYSRIDDLEIEHWFDWMGQLTVILGFDFASIRDVIIALSWTFVFSFVFLSVFWTFLSSDRETKNLDFILFARKKIVLVWLSNLLLYIVVFCLPWYLLLGALLIVPLISLLGPTIVFYEAGTVKDKLSKGFHFGRGSFGNMFISLLVSLLFICLLLQPFALVFSIHNEYTNKPAMKDLLDMFVENSRRFIEIYSDYAVVYGNIIRQIFYLTFLFLLVPFFAVLTGVCYFSEVEKKEARSLKQAFLKFGKTNPYKESKEDFE
ncbi:MAG: stage II sporulation protein M [Flavobacteriia bacterium]